MRLMATNLAKEFHKAHISLEEKFKIPMKIDNEVGWDPPRSDWVQLNTDGAFFTHNESYNWLRCCPRP